MLLEASDVTMAFGSFRAVSGASLALDEGEIIGILYFCAMGAAASERVEATSPRIANAHPRRGGKAASTR